MSMIDADLAEQLQLEGDEEPLDLQFAIGASVTVPSQIVKLGISGIDAGAVRYDIGMVQTAKGMMPPAQTLDRDDVVLNNNHLADIPFATFENARPQILLGLEQHYLGLPLEIRTVQRPQSVTASRTRLGWVLFGGSDGPSRTSGFVLNCRRMTPAGGDDDAAYEADRLDQLHELVRQHFTTEDFGVKVASEPIQSDDDRRALDIMKSTTKRTGERFETGLLWNKTTSCFLTAIEWLCRGLLMWRRKCGVTRPMQNSTRRRFMHTLKKATPGSCPQ